MLEDGRGCQGPFMGCVVPLGSELTGNSVGSCTNCHWRSHGGTNSFLSISIHVLISIANCPFAKELTKTCTSPVKPGRTPAFAPT